jgi:hypothetical protein
VRERLGGAAFRDCGLFDPKAVSAMVERHESGDFDHNQAIWQLLMFDGWLKSVHTAPATVQPAHDAAVRVSMAAAGAT